MTEVLETFEYNGTTYDVSWESEDTRHGGPFDRGSADSYYGRPAVPHYFVGATYSGLKVSKRHMTPEEIKAYYAGYEYNESVIGSKKDWG